MSTDERAEREFSAGGVVVRGDEVAVIRPKKRDQDGNAVIALPKGHLDGAETAEEAAAREVREETGIVADVVCKLGDVRYFYQRKGRRIFKVVEFFLFDYRDGDVADHDDEIEEAWWWPLERASRELSYPGEREMVVRALSRTQDSV
jgi:8-oxo-dGTP pyrophosphatase MutT (NUDIX family)